MADVFSKAKRSEVMSRIRSRGNQDTELVLAALLRAHKITGWRRHLAIQCRRRRKETQTKNRKLIGDSLPRHLRVRPDFVFPKSRTAIFVDGCFWHGCPRHATQPRGNAAFWRKKFAANKARDRRVNRALRKAGWKVVRIWEHELARKREARLLARIQRGLNRSKRSQPRPG